MSVRSFRELIAWQKAVDLVIEIYQASASFPKEELYGLTSQLRRAAISIPSNIAEGQGRDSTPEFLRFISIAYGSICELQTQIIIAQRLEYLSDSSANALFDLSSEVARILNGLRNALAAKP